MASSWFSDSRSAIKQARFRDHRETRRPRPIPMFVSCVERETVGEALKPATKCPGASNPSAALEAESGAAFLPPAPRKNSQTAPKHDTELAANQPTTNYQTTNNEPILLPAIPFRKLKTVASTSQDLIHRSSYVTLCSQLLALSSAASSPISPCSLRKNLDDYAEYRYPSGERATVSNPTTPRPSCFAIDRKTDSKSLL